MPKDDPVEKLRGLIRDTVGEMLDSRDQERERKEREAKDPAERVRGMIRDEVASALEPFKAFFEGVEEGKQKEGAPKGKKKEEEGEEGEGDSFIVKLLGGANG